MTLAPDPTLMEEEVKVDPEEIDAFLSPGMAAQPLGTEAVAPQLD